MEKRSKNEKRNCDVPSTLSPMSIYDEVDSEMNHEKYDDELDALDQKEIKGDRK
jgi:hypothetical protein